jgi:enamine deaminase RidA (YjgF/YER057c/UK114 family)
VARRLISSAQPLEQRYRYSRAVASDGHVWVSGTVANMPDGGDPPSEPYEQARRALEIVVEALTEAGATPSDVVRTRIYVTAPEHMPEVMRAHMEVFGQARPATTALVVELLDPRWLVEFEAEAILERSG